jgi:hypothetical protein
MNGSMPRLFAASFCYSALKHLFSLDKNSLYFLILWSEKLNQDNKMIL